MENRVEIYHNLNQQIIHYYDDLLADYGEDILSVWNNFESQAARFRVLSQIGDLNQCSLLDAGCGFADFYIFLEKQGIQLSRYTGLDINPTMIKIASDHLEGKNVELINKPILELDTKDRWDYVIGSGLFCVDIPEWDAMFRQTVIKLCSLAKTGVGINMLSSYSPNQRSSESYYADPLKILEYILTNVSRRVVLRHDYRTNDFTIYIYTGDSNKAPYSI